MTKPTTLRFLTLALGVGVLTIVPTAIARADIAQPRPKPPVEHPSPKPTEPHENTVDVEIESGDNVEAQVWLPPEMRADAGGGTATVGGLGPVQTIAAGIALSLSLAFGGLWLARMRRTIGGRATLGAASVLVAIASTAVFGLANAAPPRNYHPADPGTLTTALPQAGTARGTARYYYGYDPGVIRIVLPRKKA